LSVKAGSGINFMSDQIIGLHDWFQTPPGQYVLAWEQAQFDRAVADIFGYHALQLGLIDLDTLAANRMQHRWIAVGSTEPSSVQVAQGSLRPAPAADRPVTSPARPRAALLTEFSALPFPEASLDLVVLPHTLELNADPHATLREVERVLVPEGRVVICGLNPASLWGLRQRRAHLYRRMGFGDLYLPNSGEFIGYWRLRDWLRLLSFEVESGRFGCYRPAVRSEKWLNRFEWMDRPGARWWPIFGAAYFVVAVKRVRGMRLLGPAWKTAKSLAAAPVSIANQVQSTGTNPEIHS
jgi:SAM-dependent methyltransferase